MGARDLVAQRARGTARKCLIAWFALVRASLQRNEMITLGSKMLGIAQCWQNTEVLGPRSLQVGPSVWWRHTKKEAEPPFLSSCTTKPIDALERSSHSWFREAP